MKGKAYLHRQKKEDRPEGDFFNTPKSLVWAAMDIIKNEFPEGKTILEPCCGHNSIAEVLVDDYNIQVTCNDLYCEENTVSQLDYTNWKNIDEELYFSSHEYIITNPPFSLWDDFVNTAKKHCKKFMFIGRLNYFGTKGRMEKDLWAGLKLVRVFNRYVDYRTTYRKDGLFHVGGQCTGWFLWDINYEGLPYIEVCDVDPWAKLGSFKNGKF